MSYLTENEEYSPAPEYYSMYSQIEINGCVYNEQNDCVEQSWVPEFWSVYGRYNESAGSQSGVVDCIGDFVTLKDAVKFALEKSIEHKKPLFIEGIPCINI